MHPKGGLLTLFLHSPLTAICVLGKIKEIPYHLWETGQAFVDRFLAEASRLLTRVKGIGNLLDDFMAHNFLASVRHSLLDNINSKFFKDECFSFISESSYLPFLGDDFLRLLLLRFIFCCVALRLHRAFKHWPALLPRSQPALPEGELLLQPSLERAMYTLIDHLELSSVFIEPREIL